MPLLLPGLSTELEGIAADPPNTAAGCAQAWADAVQTYAAGIVPASTTVAVAAATLNVALAAAFVARPGTSLMETAFAAFAVTVGGGMAGFTPTPPPGLIGLAALFASNQATHAAGATAISNAIDTWMRTGTAVPTAGGSPVNWS